ncbi:MAG: T9SS type A sorting domain-containing protein [Algibacter sp.]|uniref:T9SS type A sorting domain-containing protein n=1 Tax=Algibacter sp. TaxID=1872428 RepID=UPI002635787F|nr:T9SS type A sorting domain-containing protein [Algibacter sp.]MDG1729333.1 T9SS type A sorting domain-containing protein [Algibacter sp.]MDG2179052.1 T9SS type A sorting domain-containing protein [Algibacter sp.]
MKTKLLKITLLFLCIVTAVGSVNAQSTIYVDGNLATGANDGSSWANAIRLGRMVQLAINASANGDEIRIASGTITDDTSITINKAVTITGGYDPSSDTRTGITTLTGVNTARRLVINGSLAISLNYLIIENGGGANAGAGALLQPGATPIFNDVQFVNNSGTNGGAVNVTSTASATFRNTVFSGNSASGNGGAVFVNPANSGTISFTNTVFVNNSATRGGGIDNVSGATLNIAGCSYFGNTATNGSGMFLGDGSGGSSSALINNTVFYGNLAGGIPQAFNTADFTKIAGSSNIASDVAGGISANSSSFISLTTDPFVDSSDLDGADNVFATSDDGLFPDTGTALVDAGDNSLNVELTDITGANRVVGTIDVGAYEGGTNISQPIIYVDGNLTTGANDGTSWANAFRIGRMVQVAINAAANGDEIRIASGSITDNSQITINKAVSITGGYDPSSDTRTGITILTGANTARRLVINGSLAIDLNYLIIANGGGGNEGAGALLQANATPTFNNVQFINNTGSNGGAVSVASGASPNFTNVVFANNSATGNGAAVFVSGTNSEIISFTNVLIANNSALRGGGIDNLSSATLNIKNGTFYGNAANNGSSMFLGASSAAILYNTVFYGNLAGGSPQAFNAQDFTIITGSSNIASDVQAGTSISDNSSNYIALTADPFTDSSDLDGADNVFATADDGLVPSDGGALVGAGDNNLESTDITGAARITGIIDIGAYESPYTLSTENVSKDDVTVRLYPNPVIDVLKVNVLGRNISKIEIYSILGKRVLSIDKRQSINVSSLTPGVYISKIYGDNNTIATKRFIKQ